MGPDHEAMSARRLYEQTEERVGTPEPQPADSRRPGSHPPPQADSTAARLSHGPCSPVVRGVVRGHAVAAVDVLRGRLAEPWTLASLAGKVHLSRSQLVRAFVATVGLSPMAYVRGARAWEMARLLDCTALSIAAAAPAVGWADANYASRCLHATCGVSPTEFRRRTCPPGLS